MVRMGCTLAMTHARSPGKSSGPAVHRYTAPSRINNASPPPFPPILTVLLVLDGRDGTLVSAHALLVPLPPPPAALLLL